MLFALLALAAAQTAAPAAGQAYPDPLTPAASGQVQCYAPSDHKTCASTASYIANGDGTFANVATVMLSSEPLAIMRSTTQVTIKAGAVCGTLQKEDILNAGLTINGQTLLAHKAAPILMRVTAALDAYFGHEICTTYVPMSDGFTAKATMEGAAQALPDQHVIWETPGDGYTVAP